MSSDTPSRPDTPPPRDASSLVELHGVDYAWPGGAPVLTGARLRIDSGERIFLHGPSGSGKSTLLNLIAGMIVPRAGTVSVLGRDLGTLGGSARDRHRADHIGFIFQMFNLIPYLSMLENVCLPCGFSARRRARATAAGASVEQEARRLLRALDLDQDGLLSRRVTDLSVGQQQRVAAARALIGGPELVIADEPTSALDAERRAAFLDLVFQECERAGSALLFVSHDRGLAARFHRSLALRDVGAIAP